MCAIRAISAAAATMGIASHWAGRDKYKQVCYTVHPTINNAIVYCCIVCYIQGKHINLWCLAEKSPVTRCAHVTASPGLPYTRMSLSATPSCIQTCCLFVAGAGERRRRGGGAARCQPVHAGERAGAPAAAGGCACARGHAGRRATGGRPRARRCEPWYKP